MRTQVRARITLNAHWFNTTARLDHKHKRLYELKDHLRGTSLLKETDICPGERTHECWHHRILRYKQENKLEELITRIGALSAINVIFLIK